MSADQAADTRRDRRGSSPGGGDLPAAASSQEVGSLPPIVGIAGYAEVGKSEVARYIEMQYDLVRGPHVKEPMIEIADVILRQLGVTSPIERMRRLDGDLKNVPIPGYPELSGRRVLQVVGKQTRDGLTPDGSLFLSIWYAASRAVAGGRPILNESVRYPFEAAWIRSQGGVIVEVIRPGKRSSDPEYEPHVPGDVEILNDTPTLSGLRATVDSAMELVRRGAWRGTTS